MSLRAYLTKLELELLSYPNGTLRVFSAKGGFYTLFFFEIRTYHIYRRESLNRGGLKLETTNTQTATLVLRAEPTVASILKTLDTDYAKNQVLKRACLNFCLLINYAFILKSGYAAESALTFTIGSEF